MIITARSNERVKFLRRLNNDKKARKESNVYVAEGLTLLSSMPKECSVRYFFIRASAEEKVKEITGAFPDAEVFVLANDVYDSASDTVSPSGITAVIDRPEKKIICGDVVLVLDGVSDAGNVGTVIRTAAAAGISDVVIMHSCADPYSPKSVRASMGGIFKINVTECDPDAIKELLDGYSFATLDMGGENIFRFEKKKKTALVVGNEAHGISVEMRALSDVTLAIPMVKDGVESLNAAVAVGIAMYIIKKGDFL